ncbi:Cell division trigger factor [Euzebya pacifica]|uniref:Trigger factor n=1 Tax=Euzebya pacifica TaxID=1608957 RepID=A0A346XVD9_9ACTN|nr:trigger factor [Euzebya pacifica]AXV06186.1 Cell division trigger factor [Euzebya pacifica]
MVTSAVEKIDDTKVKLSITIDPDEVSSALDQAVTRLSQSVKVPGFRPGKKVPLKVLEGRLGKGAVREEAIREAFPGFYSQALSEHEISPVGPPEFDVDAFEPGAEGAFTATVDVRPEFEVPEFEGMTITHPEWELTDEELHANLDQVRERFAEVETVERPAQKGDFVTVTISGKKADGTEVEEASAEDMLYQVPEEDTDSELDTQLVGASAGDVLEFTDVLGPDYPDGLAGQEISFTAIVKEVKVKTLPELDDEFALTASEFDTIDELMDDLRTQAGAEKRQMAVANLRGAVIEAIAELVEIPLPESLVEEEQRFRLNRLAHQAQHAGLSMDQFLSIAGGDDPQALMDQIREESENTVKAQLVVDEIGQKVGITVEREDLGQEVARQAMRMGRDPNEIAEMMLHPDRIGALYADAYRRKTIDHVLEHVEITDAPPPEPEPEESELEDTDVEDTEPTELEDTEAEVEETEADEEE